MLIAKEAENLVSCIGGEIEEFFTTYSLKSIYSYNFPVNNGGIFNTDEAIKINSLRNGFEKNKLLKEILCMKLNSNDDLLQYYNWIVKEWGGIRSFGKTIEEINGFINKISTKKLNSIHYNTISSYSKIISFLHPDDYFIYDSKVAYVLNWLLLKNYKRESKYFFVPPGRNADLVKYNMDTIIYLHDKNSKKDYFDKKYVYFIYCEFIKKLFIKIQSNVVEKAYFIEMMLFGLFEEVCEEIKSKVKVEIG